MRVLQEVSDSSRQTLTYKCRNHDINLSTTSFETFLGCNVDANKRNGAKPRYVDVHVDEDNCNMTGEWGQKVFTLESRKAEALPILDVDINESDINGSQAEFKIVLGEVCFRA